MTNKQISDIISSFFCYEANKNKYACNQYNQNNNERCQKRRLTKTINNFQTKSITRSNKIAIIITFIHVIIC